MKGYKVFNPDWKCKDFQYKVGETFTHNGRIDICEEGFHFCQKLSDCFRYYPFDSNNKVAAIEAVGQIITKGDKSVTDEIKIVREISWHEVLDLVNTGKNCTGNLNSGYFNSGNRNSGYFNSGNCNSGNCNSGNFNSCNYSAGYFNSATQTVYAFNKPLNISREDFMECTGMQIMSRLRICEWIFADDMTDKEKEQFPTYETTGSYLKKLDFKEACQKLWDSLDDDKKQSVCEIPNFDPVVFKQITGIDVTDGGDYNAKT